MLEITWHLFQIYTILSQCTLAYIFNYIISQIRHKLQVGVDSIFACTVTVVLAAPGWLKTPVGRSAGKSLAVRGWRAAGVAVPAADARWMHGGIFFFFFRSRVAVAPVVFPAALPTLYVLSVSLHTSSALLDIFNFRSLATPDKRKKNNNKTTKFKNYADQNNKKPPKKTKTKVQEGRGGRAGGGERPNLRTH